MKKLILLGSTGSIGTQTADVVRRRPRDFSIVGLSAHSNLPALKAQIREFKPKVVSVWEESTAEELSAWSSAAGLGVAVFHGLRGLVEVAKYTPADLVISAVVGSVGLQPLISAIRSGTNVALANKEALVIAGRMIMDEAKKNRVSIIPVDSEHSAIFQCLHGQQEKAVKRIILTASGGPFYRDRKRHSAITVEDALAHPTWIMGRKITIDSATMMNKGLEAIEASHLFNVPLSKIDIVIHPQSIIHSMVEFVDGSVIAQMSSPDMRLPIQYAMTWPERLPSPVPRLDLARIGRLEFDEPDFRRFPCLKLALNAGERGGTMPAVMNAANEVAVSWFLKNKINFAEIPAVIETVMKSHRCMEKPKLPDLVKADAVGREKAENVLAKKRP